MSFTVRPLTVPSGSIGMRLSRNGGGIEKISEISSPGMNCRAKGVSRVVDRQLLRVWREQRGSVG